jgi:hypothetical protein
MVGVSFGRGSGPLRHRAHAVSAQINPRPSACDPGLSRSLDHGTLPGALAAGESVRARRRRHHRRHPPLGAIECRKRNAMTIDPGAGPCGYAAASTLRRSSENRTDAPGHDGGP